MSMTRDDHNYLAELLEDELMFAEVKRHEEAVWNMAIDLAKLAIVEIPDGIDWEIDEYDGIESIAEKHRTWG